MSAVGKACSCDGRRTLLEFIRLSGKLTVINDAMRENNCVLSRAEAKRDLTASIIYVSIEQVEGTVR